MFYVLNVTVSFVSIPTTLLERVEVDELIVPGVGVNPKEGRSELNAIILPSGSYA